jgi:hypothetical protein
MSRLRLISATLLALVAPGTGIGLVSDGCEGFVLYLIFRVFTPGVYAASNTEVAQNHPAPRWIMGLIFLFLIWGTWAFIDAGNVIYRAKKQETLPDVQGPYPLPLLWLAGFFILLGLAFIPAIYLPKPNYSLGFFWPHAYVGPFFIVIADRLLRRRSGWRIFTIILLVVSLVPPLYPIFLVASGKASYQPILPIFWLIFTAQFAVILAALVILFLPSTRAFFRKPQTQPETQPGVTAP